MKQVVRCFLFKKDKILLVKHNEKLKWTLPWWHVEKGENLYDAIKREIKEEFNLEIELTNHNKNLNYKNIKELPLPISVYIISFESLKYWNVKNLENIFVANVVFWNIKVQKEEIFDYKWFTREEILKIKDIYPQILDLLITKIKINDY